MPTQRNRVVVRFNDGRIFKGYTHDFLPEKDLFHLIEDTASEAGGVHEVEVSNLKAIFFVKTFNGNKEYNEKKSFKEIDAATLHGIKIKVTFKDGEVLCGLSLGYNKTKKGFFIIPIDPLSNNDRIYIVAASTAQVVVGPAAEQ
ncbi:MAG: hypothetical protein WC674_10260 [Candidatus Krumholzibacteriia bacterium]